MADNNTLKREIYGLQCDSQIARAVMANMADTKYTMQYFPNVSCECDVFSEQVYPIAFGPEKNFRPRLKVEGRVRTMDIELPGIDKVRFSYDEDKCPRYCFIYDYTDEELAFLSQNGYFSENFEVPDYFIKNIFEKMPAQCNVYYIEPNEGEVPIVIVDTHSWSSILTNEECGYAIAQELIPADEATSDKMLDSSYIQPESEIDEMEFPVSEDYMIPEQGDEDEDEDENKVIEDEANKASNPEAKFIRDLYEGTIEPSVMEKEAARKAELSKPADSDSVEPVSDDDEVVVSPSRDTMSDNMRNVIDKSNSQKDDEDEDSFDPI